MNDFPFCCGGEVVGMLFEDLPEVVLQAPASQVQTQNVVKQYSHHRWHHVKDPFPKGPL